MWKRGGSLEISIAPSRFGLTRSGDAEALGGPPVGMVTGLQGRISGGTVRHGGVGIQGTPGLTNYTWLAWVVEVPRSMISHFAHHAQCDVQALGPLLLDPDWARTLGTFHCSARPQPHGAGFENSGLTIIAVAH